MTKGIKRQAGFTLLEATIAMVLLAIAAAGILLPFANAVSVQAEGARQTMAANLASELMEKILAAEYANIMSYDGYSESTADGTLKDAAGMVHTGSAYAGFARSATCQTVDVGTLENILIAVTVTVFYQNQEITRVTTLVGDHE
jgi:prepilin-type N-terminal cleavage/methylation domain-containing protein